MSVTYKVVALPGLALGETGYLLSNGDYAAVIFSPGEGAAPDMFSIKATARAVAKDGSPVLGHDGKPICCHKHVSTPKASLLTGKSSGAGVQALAIEAVINDSDGLVAECAAARAFIQLFPPIPSPPKGVQP